MTGEGVWGGESYKRSGQQAESYRKVAVTYRCTNSCAGLLIINNNDWGLCFVCISLFLGVSKFHDT